MTTRTFSVRLTPSEFKGLSRAMAALNAEMAPLEEWEYRGSPKMTHAAASRAWDKVKAAYYGDVA